MPHRPRAWLHASYLSEYTAGLDAEESRPKPAPPMVRAPACGAGAVHPETRAGVCPRVPCLARFVAAGESMSVGLFSASRGSYSGLFWHPHLAEAPRPFSNDPLAPIA